MTTSHGSRVRAAAVLVAVTLGAAACGSSSIGGSRPPTPVQQRAAKAAVLAAVTSTRSSSYHFTVSTTLTGMGSSASALGAIASGAEDTRISGSGEFSDPQDAIETSFGNSAGGSTASSMSEILFLNKGVAYVSLGAAAGGKWAELSGAKSLGALSSELSSLGGEGGPSQYLQTMNAAVESVQVVGHPSLGGVATTEYAVTENLAELMGKAMSGGLLGDITGMFSPSSATGSESKQAAAAMSAALQALPKTIVMSMWIDGSGHLRQISLVIPLGKMMSAMVASILKSMPAGELSGVSAVSGGGAESAQQVLSALEGEFAGAAETETIGFSGFGEPVDIQAPPASEITGSGLTGLLGGITGATGTTGSFATGSTGSSQTVSGSSAA